MSALLLVLVFGAGALSGAAVLVVVACCFVAGERWEGEVYERF